MYRIIQLSEGNVVGVFNYDELPYFVGNDARFIQEPNTEIVVGWRLVNSEWQSPSIQAAIDSPVPSEVSNIQAFAAIKHFGMLPSVMAHMDSLAPDNLVRVTWEKAATFKRSSPTLVNIASLLQLTEEQLDALFLYASTIQV